MKTFIARAIGTGALLYAVYQGSRIALVVVLAGIVIALEMVVIILTARVKK